MAEIPTPISVREELLATRPDTAATAMPVDKPEAVLTFPLPARQEKTHQNFIRTPKPSSQHDIKCRMLTDCGQFLFTDCKLPLSGRGLAT